MFHAQSFMPRLAACLVLVTTVSSVRAQTLHDNGDPSEGFGVSILSELGGNNQLGDDFELASSSAVSRIEWWGEGNGNDFSIRIFALAGGVPGTEPVVLLDAGAVTGTPEDFGGLTFDHFVFETPDLTLAPGRYLLSIVDRDPDERWFWAVSCEDGCEGLSWRRAADGDAWRTGDFSAAFRIGGIPAGAAKVPADSSATRLILVLLLISLGGFASFRASAAH